MWIPKDADELEAAVASASLEETPSLEFKRQLPPAGSSGNRRVAREVAGLAVSGGSLIYGVDEDESGRPTILTPFELAGARERVEQIIESSIQEPPHVEVIPLWKDESLGYLLIVVPASPRAPHQVTAGGECVYYGRSGTRTVPLEEGTVARLYRQRAEWAEKDDLFMQGVVGALRADGSKPTIWVGVRPLGHVQVARDGLTELVRTVVEETRSGTRDEYPPYFLYRGVRPRADGIRINMAEERQWDQALDVLLDGTVRFMSERPGEVVEERYWLFAEAIGTKVLQVLTVAGQVLDASGYLGSALVGLALYGAEGAPAFLDRGYLLREPHPFHTNEYREVQRVPSHRLRTESKAVARELTENLFYALAVPDRYNLLVDD